MVQLEEICQILQEMTEEGEVRTLVLNRLYNKKKCPIITLSFTDFNWCKDTIELLYNSDVVAVIPQDQISPSSKDYQLPFSKLELVLVK